MTRELTPLIEPSELAALLSRTPAAAPLLVVDCRADIADSGWGARAYAQGHIAGAVHAHLDRDLSGPVDAHSGRHPLPDAAAFAATLGRWGVTPLTRVVAYDQGPGPYAARLWWMLRAVGHPYVQVLDGGLAAWRAAGLPETAAVVAVAAAATVEPRQFRGSLTSEQVRAGVASDALLLVDARTAERFAGRQETVDPVAGHVPGAVNRPFGDNLGADGRFLSPAQLAAQWQRVLGARDPRTAAMMCGSGVTACHNLLALELASLPGAQLYAGSWSEWIRDPARPVAT
jgi:thiosulfate/3-mercaptopyruvate sulfurtransferase